MFIDTAYAQQNVSQVAQNGANMAVNTTTNSLQSLITFVARNIDNWIGGIIILIISWILAKMAAKAIKKTIIKKKGDDIQESVLVLVERITTILVLIIGFSVAAAINGFNFTAVIGALSLGIGFALKDIIGNFISGIIMLSQDRIKIGDLINIDGILGTIVSIDTRATILQATDGTEVVIPNQEMLNKTIISYSTNPFRRIILMVGVDYGTNLTMLLNLLKKVVEQNENIIPKPESQILIDEFAASSINIKIIFWIESNINWMRVKSDLSNQIKIAFDKLNINIPFPITTLKVDENDQSILKTLQSAKNNYVPENKKVPNEEDILKALNLNKKIVQNIEENNNIQTEINQSKELENKEKINDETSTNPIPPASHL